MRGVLQRLVPWLLVRAALGVLTTLLVSWALAAWLPHEGLVSRYAMKFGPATDLVPTGIMVQRYSRLGMERRGWKTVSQRSSGGLLLEADLRSKVVRADNGPMGPGEWGLLDDVVARRSGAPKSGGEDGRGWPMLAFWCQIEEAFPSGYASRGGITLSPVGTRVGAARVLPLTPIWRGLAADTAVYGAVWAVAIVGFVGVRGVVRRRRGECPKCGYDVKGGEGCSECGWERREAKGEGRE